MGKTPDLVHVRADQNHMATTFSFRVSCERAQARIADSVLLECHEIVSRLENELSEFRAHTPISKLNAAQAFEEIHLPSSALDLLEASARIARETNGAFDCTVKSGTAAQDIFARIAWDRARGVAWKITQDARVSFAAIGKGYAIDQARTLIERAGFTDYLLEAGGSSIALSGFSAPNVPWTWGWSWERDEFGEPKGIPFEHTSGERISIGVSGLHEKGRHLINPATRAEVAACKTALIAHPSATEADALSTALFVSQGAMKLDTTLPCAMASIDSNGIPRWNGWFQKFWGAFLFVALSANCVRNARADDGALDLGSMGKSVFNPYLFERHGWLIVLPALAIGIVLVHCILWRRLPGSATVKLPKPLNGAALAIYLNAQRRKKPTVNTEKKGPLS